MIDPNFAAVSQAVMDWLRASYQYISANLPAALATAFAAFFGTFIGAYCAFLFERKHQEKLALDADSAAGRQAQFALVMQFNTMKNMWTQHLGALEQDEHRYVTLKPIVVLPDYHYPRLPFNELGYFLEDDEEANILGETMVEEDRFFTFVRFLEQRNSRHENMQRVAARTGTEILRSGVDQAILKDMTDSLYRLASDVLTHHPASIKTIRDYLKKRFPKYRALGLEP